MKGRTEEGGERRKYMGKQSRGVVVVLGPAQLKYICV